jgi:NADH-quinone oxidoreductase subunit G
MARRTGRHRRGGRATARRRAARALAGVTASAAAQAVAQSLAVGERRAVLLGNAPCVTRNSRSCTRAQWIAEQTGATLGFLTEAANTVGAHAVGALPGKAA